MKTLSFVIASLAVAAWSAIIFIQIHNLSPILDVQRFLREDSYYLSLPLVGLFATGIMGFLVARIGEDGRLFWLLGSLMLALFFLLVISASAGG